MIAVIFEVEINDGQQSAYIELAAKLKQQLDTVEGFISIERFTSLTNSEKLLSLSFWRDEASVKQWRELDEHRQAQSLGRVSIFKDYQLSVANVTRRYGKLNRDTAPKDSIVFHQNF